MERLLDDLEDAITIVHHLFQWMKAFEELAIGFTEIQH
jgi:hypothetical protein